MARTHAPSSLRDLDDSPAAATMEATKAQLRLDFLSHRDDAEGFAEMCALPKADKDAIFAYCIVATLQPLGCLRGHRCSNGHRRRELLTSDG